MGLASVHSMGLLVEYYTVLFRSQSGGEEGQENLPQT